MDDNPNTLLERDNAGLNVRLSYLPGINRCAVNVVFDGVPMAVTVPLDKAHDAYHHPMVYLAPAQVDALGVK